MTTDATRLTRHWPLLVIIALYLILSAAHSLIAPLTTGNDEWAHFLYLRFIAENGHLPATLAERAEAGYKSDAPPLFHLLAAAATAGVEPTRLLRPLADDQPRRYLADNIIDSYALVHTAVEQWPLAGEVLLWHLGRGLSLLFGAALIAVTYLTSLHIAPGNARRAALAAALVAFIPSAIFHSSVLSYESLSATLTALFLLFALLALDHPRQRRWWLLLGASAGLAVTTKYSAVLLPLEILFVGWLASRRGAGSQTDTPPATRNSPFTIHHLPFTILLSAAAMLLAVSWWFGFVLYHFNTIETQGPLVGLLQPLLVGDGSDTTSVQVAGFLFGQESVAADSRPPLARDYPALLLSLLNSFWAAPVAGRFLASPWPALLASLLAALGVAGLWPVWRTADARTRAILLLLAFHTLLIVPLLLVRVAFSYDPREVAQGRHILLPAASAIAILLVWGWERWPKAIAPLAVVGLLLWSAAGQVGAAWLRYPPPISVWPAAPAAAATQPSELPVAGMRLTGARWQPQADALAVTLWWQAQSTLPQDYLIELTLLDAAGRPVGFALGHPAQGRFPTRAWEPGDVIEDVHRLPLRISQPGAFSLQLRLLTRAGNPAPGSEPVTLGEVQLDAPANATGLFAPSPLRPNVAILLAGAESPVLRLADGRVIEPLKAVGPFATFIVGPDWPASGRLEFGGNAVALAFDIPLRNFTAPEMSQPVAANFNGEVEMLGYDLPARRIEPGGRLPLTFYWRALDYTGEDYRIFANPLDAAQQRWGGYDRRPRDGYSTLRWVPGEVITDPFGIPIDPAAPPGVYSIAVGLYRENAAGAESLPLIGGDGQPTGATSLRLGPIKVGGPPPEVIAANPQPQHIVNQPFGEAITLLGYDQESGVRSQESWDKNSPNSLHLTLYWQADAIPAADYTTFLHLRDAANQNVAQKDSPPAGGRYPSSLWDAGEVIVDEILLPLDGVSPGSYTPVIGLYEPASGQRQLTPGHPANEFALEPVQVTSDE